MSIKELLKKNDLLRRFVKTVKIYIEFLGDAKDYSYNYLESAEKRGNYKYRIMLIVHSLEKGMCMTNLRPFGHKKVVQLVDILSKTGRNKAIQFEYDLAISVLFAWVKMFEDNGWEIDVAVNAVKQFLKDKTKIYEAGKKKYLCPEFNSENRDFSKVMLSRHSVRDYEEKELEEKDIEYALQMFVEAPTACNRQMCKVYQVKNSEVVELLNKTILGVSGFNKKSIHYFVITYDIAAFDFYGERNQGYFNAGLVAMNFANGLHARGIGSCFMQWANKRSEDLIVRDALGLNSSEKIAVILGAGYYKEESIIPSSCRRSINEVYRIVE